MTACLFLLAALVDFSDAGHGWVRSSPHLREMRQVADGALIRFEGADPHLTSPVYAIPAPPVPGSRVVYELKTSPSDIRSYTLYYSFGDVPPDELTKLELLPVERQPPFTCYRGELPSPDVLPGCVRYRLDPPGGQRASTVLRSFDWRFKKPLWDGGFDVALPHDFSSSVSLVGEGWTLRQDPHRFLAWAIDVGGERVVESPDSEPVLYQDAGGTVRAIDWKTAQVKVSELGDRLQVTAQVRDAENVLWQFERTFVARTANVLEVLSRVSTEKPVRIVHLPYLTALVDRGSRGHKTQAVLPGVEYLADEPSSNEKELLGRHARRGVVEAWKITSPLMLLIRLNGEGARAVSLGWERPDPLGPQVASAVFDTPDRRFRSGGHLMGLWAPAVGAGRESGEWGVYEAPSFSGGEVRATIALGDEKTAGSGLARLVRTLPPVLLPSDEEIAGRLAGAWAEGRLGTGGVWRTECGRKGREMVAVDAYGALEWLAVAQPSLAPALDSLQRQTLAKAATTDGNARFGWGEQLFRWSCPDAPFVWGDAYRRQLDQEGHLARMVAAWRKGYCEYRPPPQGHDFSRGLEAKDVNGLSSYNTLWLMRTAVWSGNETLISEALAVADRTRERYAGTVPRGAQSWEMPLHCPDLLASANLSEAFALAYLLSADVKFLDAARDWASTGLAFVSTDGFAYATTGVFGASEWRLTDWIGRPVQWCGLVYAHALLRLSEVETMASRRDFWRQLASGICACAVRQCWPTEDPSYGGLLPDSVDPVSGARYLGALNTRGLIEVAAGLGSRPLYAVIRPVADRPYLVQAPAKMSAETPCGDELVRLSLSGWMRRPFQLLVTRIDGPVSVFLDGRPVPCRFRNRTVSVELPAGASGRLTLRPGDSLQPVSFAQAEHCTRGATSAALLRLAVDL